MRGVLIKLPLSEDEAAMFEGNGALIIPTSEAEAARFRDLFDFMHGCLAEASKSNPDLVPLVENMNWMRAYLSRASSVEADQRRAIQ